MPGLLGDDIYNDPRVKRSWTPEQSKEFWDRPGLLGINAYSGDVSPFTTDLASKVAQNIGTEFLTFGGVGAVGAPLADLAKAKGLLDDGVDAARVWYETGWFKGPEGKWRFEIDDSGARFMGPDSAGKLPDAMQHDEAYSAYPQLKDVTVSRSGGTGGSYLDNDIEIGKRAENRTLLHETQHAIQDIEDFAVGGSPNNIAIPKDEVMRMYDLQKELVPKLKAGEITEQEFRAAMDLAGKEAMYRTYHNLAGEIEARDVANRMPMTSWQRRVVPPGLMSSQPTIVRPR